MTVGTWWRTALGSMVLLALGGCGFGGSAACVQGLEFDGKNYREYPSQAELPTDGVLGEGLDGECSDEEPDGYREDPVSVLKIRDVDPEIAVIVKGQPDALWINAEIRRGDLPEDLAPYLE